MRLSLRATRRSRSAFSLNFFRQKPTLLFGMRKCRGQPCHQQPLQNTTSLHGPKTMSGLPGSFACTRKRSPAACSARRTSISGLVSLLRMLDMILLRCSGLTRSTGNYT
jgi:hypothetical protein